MIDKKILVPTLSGFLYGYTTSIIAAAVIFIGVSFHLDAFEIGLVASIILLGAACSMLFAGKLANFVGRKYTILLGAILFFTGTLLTSFTDSYTVLLIGRFILGISCGLALTVTPIYLMEISPPEKRGRNATFNQIGIASGSLMAYSIGYLLSFSHNWRLMLGLAVIPSLIQLVGVFFIPDSYKFDAASSRGSWGELFAKNYRPRLYLGLGLNAFQSLVGSPVIFYFAPYLFEKDVNQDLSKSLIITVFIGVVYLLGIVFCLFNIEKWGRRRLFLSSLLGMFIFLLLIIVFSWFQLPYFYAVTFASVLLYMIFYSLGIGPIPPLVVMEITPVNIRSYAATFASLAGLICAYFVTLTGPMLIETFTISGAFCIYAFFSLLGFFIFLRKLPETKEKSIGEIEKLF